MRQYERQAIFTNATVVPAVPERQTVVIKGGVSGELVLEFRGERAAVSLDLATWAQLEAALEALVPIDDVELTPDNATCSEFVAAGCSFDVTFVGALVRGDVPMIRGSKVSVEEVRKGDAPFVREVQVLTCDAPTNKVRLLHLHFLFFPSNIAKFLCTTHSLMLSLSLSIVYSLLVFLAFAGWILYC